MEIKRHAIEMRAARYRRRECVHRLVHATRNGVVALTAAVSMTASWGASGESRFVPGYPDDVQAFDSREVAILPNYCAYTQVFRSHVPGGNNPSEIEHWNSVMGPTFNAMHHYCWGLMKLNRATLLARTQQAKTFYFGDAISEFDYVLERAPADFVLLPEILTRKGDALMALGKDAQAVEFYERAITSKSDYWPPYAALGDYYKKTGNVAAARKVLEQGIAAIPDAKALITRLSNLEKAAKPVPRTSRAKTDSSR